MWFRVLLHTVYAAYGPLQHRRERDLQALMGAHLTA